MNITSRSSHTDPEACSKSPRKQLSPIAVSLATSSMRIWLHQQELVKKKRNKGPSNWVKHRGIYIVRNDVNGRLPVECFKSLPTTAPAPSFSSTLPSHAPSPSTPPSIAPSSPFPHFSPLLLRLIFASSFNMFPLIKKVKMTQVWWYGLTGVSALIAYAPVWMCELLKVNMRTRIVW